jgi:hypothetical protein
MYDVGNIVQKVQIWMEHCVLNLDRLTLQTFAQDEDFWSTFPTIVELILRRKYELNSTCPPASISTLLTRILEPTFQ